jgi:hypothetical protein
MQPMPYKQVADHLASYGRLGDSQLVHMNPIEVQMLGSLSPTGQLTINPVTGQPEAFLPFLAPLLGSWLGTTALAGSTLGGLLGTGLSKAAAGAIGSALASTAATGDLKEGILSGITGFGLGKVFGAMGGADKLAGAAGSTPTPANVEGFFSPTGGGAALNQATTATAPILAGAPTSAPVGGFFSPTGGAAAFNPVNAAQSAAGAGPGSMNFSAGLEELMKPGTFLPIYAGTSVTEGIRQQEELDRLMKEQGLSEEEAKRKYEEDARRAIETAQRLYPQMRPPKGMAAGGQVEGYLEGGAFSNQFGLNNMTGGFYDTEFGRSSPSDIQGRLRGNISVAAPYASYGALDVGGRGYLPGIAPEFQYFRQAEEVYPQQPLYPTMNRGKGGGFGGGNQFGGGYSSMPGGKGGGYSSGYGNPFGGGYSGGYGSMPGGKGGYNTGYGGGYGGGYGNTGGGYGNVFDRYSQPYSNYGGSSFGNFNQIMPF